MPGEQNRRLQRREPFERPEIRRDVPLWIRDHRAASAEHEVQFRYTVLGYVKDAAGRPRKGVALEVTRQKTGLSYPGETDASGLYVIVTRLADESLGERLLVRAGPRSLRITAQFDPADHAVERGTRVDFTGSKEAERPELFPATLKQFLNK